MEDITLLSINTSNGHSLDLSNDGVRFMVTRTIEDEYIYDTDMPDYWRLRLHLCYPNLSNQMLYLLKLVYGKENIRDIVYSIRHNLLPVRLLAARYGEEDWMWYSEPDGKWFFNALFEHPDVVLVHRTIENMDDDLSPYLNEEQTDRLITRFFNRPYPEEVTNNDL